MRLLSVYTPNLLNELFNADSLLNETPERRFSPNADIIESEKNYVLNFDLPGIDKNDIKIEVNKGTLIVSGERKRETSEENRYRSIERTFGKFQRSFKLPEDAGEDISANFENGVLEVTLPKKPEAQPKVVEIN